MRTSFGAALLYYYQRAGGPGRLSINEVARRCGLDPSAVSRLMRDERFPRRDTVDQLAQALSLRGIDESELYLSAGYAPPSWSGASIAQKAGLALVGLILTDDALSERSRERFLQVILTLAQQWAEQREEP